MKIPFKDRSQMTMKEKIANPLSVKEALELSEEIQKSIIQAFNSNVAYKCYENQMGYLVGGSRLPSTPEEMELEHKCNPYPNDRIVKVGDTFMPYALARLVMIQKQGGHHE